MSKTGRIHTRTDTHTFMHARADTDLLTHGWYLTLSVIDTGLDLENHCHSSLRRSNSHIISHKGKRDGGNKKRDRGGEHEGGRGEGGGAVSSVKCFFFFFVFHKRRLTT